MPFWCLLYFAVNSSAMQRGFANGALNCVINTIQQNG